MGLLGMWAGSVFRVKTLDGTLMVEVDEPNPDVSVDGGNMKVRWDRGGKEAEIRVQPGTHDVKVTKDGFAALGERVELSEGQRVVLRARLEQLPRKEPGPGGPPEAGTSVPKPAVQPRPASTADEGRRPGAVRDDNALEDEVLLVPHRDVARLLDREIRGHAGGMGGHDGLTANPRAEQGEGRSAPDLQREPRRRDGVLPEIDSPRAGRGQAARGMGVPPADRLRNGNTRAEQERRRPPRLATGWTARRRTSAESGPTTGRRRDPACGGPRRSVRTALMPGEFTTCTATSASSSTRRVGSEAGAGTTAAGTAARRSRSLTHPTRPITWGSAWPE